MNWFSYIICRKTSMKEEKQNSMLFTLGHTPMQLPSDGIDHIHSISLSHWNTKVKWYSKPLRYVPTSSGNKFFCEIKPSRAKMIPSWLETNFKHLIRRALAKSNTLAQRTISQRWKYENNIHRNRKPIEHDSIKTHGNVSINAYLVHAHAYI